jgi:hypothetical protein
MPSKAISPQNGPSAHLISRINHLGNLLRFLPENLPLDPSNTAYSFGLDAEQVAEEGVWFAFNNCLEVSFRTHTIPETIANELPCQRVPETDRIWSNPHSSQILNLFACAS